MKRLLTVLRKGSVNDINSLDSVMPAKLRKPESSHHQYAKILFPEYDESYIGKRFKLFQGDRLVWGNEIERPAVGYPLEYRNIIIAKSTSEEFTVSPPIPFEIDVSDIPFSTEEQNEYDRKYHVTQHENGLWYTVRGNTENPKFLLLTFPGFGPSTTRIAYAVSYLSQLSALDLEDTLLIAFQDRYQVHGTYMITDDTGALVYPQFRALIDTLREKYSILSENILFFGASKGASIALMYMKDFPEARLIIMVPQLNIRYYLQAKSFFRNNLFHYFKEVDFEEPISLFRTYLREKRKIWYFYTDNDELSNYSLIERVQGFPSLNKYRVDGNHGEVAKKALPTVLCLMRSIVLQKGKQNFTSIYLDIYPGIEGKKEYGVQICLPNSFIDNKNINVYTRSSLNGTIFYQFLHASEQRTIWYTNTEEVISSTITGVGSIDGISVFDPNGQYFESFETVPLNEQAVAIPSGEFVDPFNELSIHTPDVKPYWILDGQNLGSFVFSYSSGAHGSRSLHVFCVTRESVGSQPPDSVTATLQVSCDKNWNCLYVLINRVMKIDRLISVTIYVEVTGCSAEILHEAIHIDLPDVKVVCTSDLTSIDYDYIEQHDLTAQFMQWLAKGKLRPEMGSSGMVAPVFRPYTKFESFKDE